MCASPLFANRVSGDATLASRPAERTTQRADGLRVPDTMRTQRQPGRRHGRERWRSRSRERSTSTSATRLPSGIRSNLLRRCARRERVGTGELAEIAGVRGAGEGRAGIDERARRVRAHLRAGARGGGSPSPRTRSTGRATPHRADATEVPMGSYSSYWGTCDSRGRTPETGMDARSLRTVVRLRTRCTGIAKPMYPRFRPGDRRRDLGIRVIRPLTSCEPRHD